MNTLASNYPFNRPAPGRHPPLADPAPGDQPAGHPPVLRHPRAGHRGPRLPLHPGMEITNIILAQIYRYFVSRFLNP
jgi:hypothetical protein